jgi:hypothetical protein
MTNENDLVVSIVTLKNVTTGKRAGRVTRKVGSAHNLSIDEFPPQGTDKLTKTKQSENLNIIPSNQPLHLHKPSDIGTPAWQERDNKD